MKKTCFILVSFIAILAVLIQPVIGQIGKIDRIFPTNFNHIPTGLTWDGVNLWQIDYTDDMICKLDPATGQQILSFPAPDGSATGLAWDGTYIWCSGNNNDKIYKMDNNGIALNSFDVTSAPRGLEFFDDHLWYVDSINRQIYKINPANGAYLDSISAPAGACRGLAFDGTYLWCTDRSLDEIYKIDINHKKVIMIIKSPAQYTYGLAWDGSCLWIAGYDSRAIVRLFVTGSNKIAILDSLEAHIQYKLTVRNVGSTLMSLNTWMCKPYNSTRQRLDSPIIWCPPPQNYTYDQWGQEFAYYNEDIAPDDSVMYSMAVNTINYDVRYYLFPDSVGTLADIPSDILSEYTINGDQYDIYNPVIQNAVIEAIGMETNLYWKVRNIHDYIIEHIYYKNDGRWDSAPQVLMQGHGSCTEYTYLFVAMCRAAGIPARYEGGGHLRDNMPYIDTIFHRWHQFYLPPYEWISVDATWDDRDYPANQARYFGGTSKELFATTLGGGGSNKISWAFNSANSQTGGSRKRNKEMIWTDIAQKEISFTFESQGWYMISLPVIPRDNGVTTLFPTAIGSRAYYWNPYTNCYETVSKIESRKGYWLAIPEATTSTVFGASLNSYTQHLHSQGWYMIGSVLGDVDFTEPDESPDGTVLTPAFTWDGNIGDYISANTLTEKKGFWITALGMCNLTVDNINTLFKPFTTSYEKRDLFFHQFGSMPPGPPIIDWKTGDLITTPGKFTLYQNYPNPFNPTTTIAFDLPEDSYVELVIYNVIGQKVATLLNRDFPAGSHKVIWDGNNDKNQPVSSGFYLYRVKLGQFSAIKKLILIR